jgi:hypothetical protein
VPIVDIESNEDERPSQVANPAKPLVGPASVEWIEPDQDCLGVNDSMSADSQSGGHFATVNFNDQIDGHVFTRHTSQEFDVDAEAASDGFACDEGRESDVVVSLLQYIKLLEEKVADYEKMIGKRPFRGKKLNPKDIQKKEFVKPSEAAVLLGGSADTVKRDCRRLRIEPHFTGGGHWLLSKGDVQRLKQYRSEL